MQLLAPDIVTEARELSLPYATVRAAILGRTWNFLP